MGCYQRSRKASIQQAPMVRHTLASEARKNTSSCRQTLSHSHEEAGKRLSRITRDCAAVLRYSERFQCVMEEMVTALEAIGFVRQGAVLVCGSYLRQGCLCAAGSNDPETTLHTASTVHRAVPSGIIGAWLLTTRQRSHKRTGHVLSTPACMACACWRPRLRKATRQWRQ